MTTKRAPIRRAPRTKITPEAVALFQKMQNLELACTCENFECEACEQWWAANHRLHVLLKLKPWDFPAVVNPFNAGPGIDRASVERYLALHHAAHGTEPQPAASS